jgi:predicted permease
VRNSYIAAEVGLALVLVSGAGLLVRSAIAARQQDPGFVAENVLTAKTALPNAQYADVESVIRAYEQILERVATIPTVSSVSVASRVPLAAGTMGLVLKQDAVPGGLATDLSVNLHYVGPNYLTAMEIPLQAGRDFSVTDRRGAHRVILVNETLARRLWPRGDALGQTLRMPELGPNNPLWEVVGVVGDVRENGLMQPVPPAVFIPFRQIDINAWQWTQQSLYIVAKTGGPPLGLADELRQAIGEVDPQLPVGDLLSMDQRFAASLTTARLYVLLLSSLGIAGLLLTAVGIYGVVAYFVARQRGEIALRMALGATPRKVLMLAMKQGMKPVGIGLLAGTLMAFGFTRVLTTQLYGVTASDPATLLAAIGLIAFVAALACFLPALKTTRIEPMKALRGE